MQAGETNKDALAREVLEECGWTVQILGKIGQATQFIFLAGEGHFTIRATYFRMALSRRQAERCEHELVWLPATEALSMLARESDIRAVSTALSPDSKFNE
jgi:8-oxo-dGTP pyrophosphatase MutT (NUDIX family)